MIGIWVAVLSFFTPMLCACLIWIGRALTAEKKLSRAEDKLDFAKVGFEHIKRNALWGVEQVCEDCLKKLNEP